MRNVEGTVKPRQVGGMKFNPALLEDQLTKAFFAFISWAEATREAGAWS
jgi:hypothetical protein